MRRVEAIIDRGPDSGEEVVDKGERLVADWDGAAVVAGYWAYWGDGARDL